MNVTADTNILLRAVLMEHPQQSPIAADILLNAPQVAVPQSALCEFAWVLRQAHKRSARDIAASIRALLAAANVTADRLAVDAGLTFLDGGGDFADGVIAYEGRRLGGDVFLTFDEKAAALAARVGLAASIPG